LTVLAGCLLEGFLPATWLTSSASGLVDRNNSHIPLEFCDSKLRALVAAQSARETERTATRSILAHRSMRTAHHSARTAPRAPLRAHRSVIPAPRAPLRAHSSARTAPQQAAAVLRSRLQQCVRGCAGDRSATARASRCPNEGGRESAPSHSPPN
jgi:hypothetical protein